MKVYATTHDISATVCRAFAKGCGGAILPPFAEDTHDDAAFYGILRGTADIIKRRWKTGQPFVYIDLGYIGAGHYGGYYRVCRSDLHCDLRPPDHRRLVNLHWTPRDRGPALALSPVLIARPSDYIAAFFGFDADQWVKDVAVEVRKHTARPISVTRKDDKSGNDLLDGAWCLMTLQSNLAVEAVRRGVPVVNPPSLLSELRRAGPPIGHPSRAMGGRIEDIESPRFPTREERTEWAARLAGQQWRLDEMQRGEVWKWLKSF